MNSTDCQHYIRTHNCACGNALSFKLLGQGQDGVVICPDNPDHTEFVRVPSPTEQYKLGQQVHPAVARNIERRMGVTMQGQALDSKSLMVIGEMAMQERFDIAMKANFGFALDHTGKATTPTAGQIKALVIYCATYGLDPLRHEVVLFGGNPLVGLDAYRRKATETGDYLGCAHKPVTNPDVKLALGYVAEDIVDECIVKRLVKGHVAEFSRYGGVRRKEIDAISQSGSSSRHPIVNKYPSEMAQNRAEKHSLRAAFQFTFMDTETSEPVIDAPFVDGTFSEIKGEGAVSSGAPIDSVTLITSESPSVSTRAPDDKGQSPPETVAATPLPLPPIQPELVFAEPEYTVPESLSTEQFQYLMKKMHVENKADMNKLLGVKPGETFTGSPKDAVDAAFAAYLAKGLVGIGTDPGIDHWAQWLPK